MDWLPLEANPLGGVADGAAECPFFHFILRPAVSALPENLLKMQIPDLHFRLLN